MGNNGEQRTSLADEAATAIMEQLLSIEGVTNKKMFGGYGIFHEGKMFGLVSAQGEKFLKVDDSNKSQYIEANSSQHSRMPYYSIPSKIISNPTELINWAKESIEVSKK